MSLRHIAAIHERRERALTRFYVERARPSSTWDSDCEEFELFLHERAVEDEFEERAERAQRLREIRATSSLLKKRAQDAGVAAWWFLASPNWTPEHVLQWQAYADVHFAGHGPVAPASRESALNKSHTWELGEGLTLSSNEILEYLQHWTLKDSKVATVIRLNTGLAPRVLAKYQRTSIKKWQLASKGLTWLKTRYERRVTRRTPFLLQDLNMLVKLGELGELLSYAAVHEVDPERLLTNGRLQDLNLALVESVKAQPRRLLEYLPLENQWKHLMPSVPYLLRAQPRPKTLKGFKCGVLLRLVEEFEMLTESERSKRIKNDERNKHHYYVLRSAERSLQEANVTAAFQLVQLFRDYEAIRRFVKACGHEWTLKGLHDAGQFSCPETLNWNQPKWAAKCLRNPAMVQFAGSFGALDNREMDPRNLRELKTQIVLCNYPEATPGYEKLRDLCAEHGVSASNYKSHLKFWQLYTPKEREALPAITINGAEVGLEPQWQFSRLAANDFRGPLLGILTGCCQHLEGAGSESARSGALDENAAFYVVTRNGVVMGQCWAWKNSTGGVVIDSWESIYRDDSCIDAFAALVKEAAHRMVNGDSGVRAVFLGNSNSGVTAQLANKLGLGTTSHVYTTRPLVTEGYFDGESHWLLTGVAPRRGTKPITKTDTDFLNFTIHNPHPQECVSEEDMRRLLAYVRFGSLEDVERILQHEGLSVEQRINLWTAAENNAHVRAAGPVRMFME